MIPFLHKDPQLQVRVESEEEMFGPFLPLPEAVEARDVNV